MHCEHLVMLRGKIKAPKAPSHSQHLLGSTNKPRFSTRNLRNTRSERPLGNFGTRKNRSCTSSAHGRSHGTMVAAAHGSLRWTKCSCESKVLSALLTVRLTASRIDLGTTMTLAKFGKVVYELRELLIWDHLMVIYHFTMTFFQALHVSAQEFPIEFAKKQSSLLCETQRMRESRNGSESFPYSTSHLFGIRQGQPTHCNGLGESCSAHKMNRLWRAVGRAPCRAPCRAPFPKGLCKSET